MAGISLPTLLWWLPILLFILSDSQAGHAQGLPVNSQLQMRNVAFGVFNGSGSEPVAICRADHVFSDFQTRGFFRIGALPLVVLDGFSIELGDANRLPTVLTNVADYFCRKDSAKRAIEGREFSLRLAAVKDFQLKAHRVRLETGTSWRLENGSVARPGVPPTIFREALLAIAGPHAGELTCQTTNGTVQVEILSLCSKSNP